MKKITKILSFCLFMMLFGFVLTGCSTNPPSESNITKYQIITESTNCTLSISENEAGQNDSIKIVHNATSNDYKLEKLYYLKGTVINGAFTASDETEYTILDDTFKMPNSAVKVVCKYKSIQKLATIKKVELEANPWGTDKKLEGVAIGIGEQAYYFNDNYNYTGTNFAWDFTQSKNSYLVKNNEIRLYLSIGLRSVDNDADYDSNALSSIVKIDNLGWAEIDVVATVNKEHTTFTLSVQFDIVEL